MGKSINSSFPGLRLALSEIFQAIEIENHTSIHNNLTEANNSRPNGYFDQGHLGCLSIFQGYIKHQNFTSIPLYG